MPVPAMLCSSMVHCRPCATGAVTAPNTAHCPALNSFGSTVGGAQQGTVVTLGALRPGPRRRLEAGVSTVCHDMDAGCGYRCTIRGCPEQGAGLRVLPSKASIHKGALQLSSATASRGVRCCRAKSLLEGTGGRGACALRVCHACTAALSRAAWRCTLTASLAPLGRAIPKRALCPTRATYSHPRSDDSLSGGPPSCNGA